MLLGGAVKKLLLLVSKGIYKNLSESLHFSALHVTKRENRA